MSGACSAARPPTFCDITRIFPGIETSAEVFQRSATDLDCIPDRCIDMVFMDPPFGSNIFYADSSLLWESWLGELTDDTAEIVVNKHRTHAAGGKNVDDYGDLMRQSFEHAARVLRLGGRAILAFSNSDHQVWAAVQKALGDAGFETERVHLLSKGQPSIKGVKGVTGRENVTTLDLVLCLEHRTRAVQMPVPFAPPASMIEEVIRNSLSVRPERTDEIYSAVIRAVVEANYSVSGIDMPMIAERCTAMGAREVDGRWTMPSLAATAKEPFFAGYLASPEALPRSTGAAPVETPMGKLRVAGGRNSALYLAHSYHTKVPPRRLPPSSNTTQSQGMWCWIPSAARA